MENYIWKWISKFLLNEKLFASSFLPLNFQFNLKHKGSTNLVTKFCTKNENFLWKSSDQRRIFWTQKTWRKVLSCATWYTECTSGKWVRLRRKRRKPKPWKQRLSGWMKVCTSRTYFDFLEVMGRTWAKIYFWKNFKFIFWHQLLRHWIMLIVIKNKILVISMRKWTINKQKKIVKYIYIYIYIYMIFILR